MYAAERHRLILDAARSLGRVEVSGLAEQLDVTAETIRRDLTALERRGLLKRVHGGAIPAETERPELALAERIGRRAAEKRRIAQRALAELPERGTVLLDAGTSTLALAQALPGDAELTVVANSPAICAALAAKPGITLLQLGGQVRSLTGAAVGRWTIDALAELTIDLGFIGANGFDAERGLTTPDQIEAATKRAMVRACRTTVLLADSAKAGEAHLHRFAELAQIDRVITDGGLDPDTAEAIRAAGPEVVFA
ncbi:DeoR/GlpR family DNA-binding transcription regulator [Leucobacter massiliensis]|uniref:Lactose phosphotransferase system repressor n=1 Tax=Leucobacter massiliensis TaxID=1686285 RepID=A0A2S9QKB3_9MICO|nr:DeoR/GlpR family DNA-binding transcription regulator [Leucobacter massiliensis]PRI10028.1 D-beta-D-heptose 1-phosphate adenosyltransferase [Leucobacter massiliensis]PRI10059.1 D-beta-D-heptose 1-phosphate adenosyltransferase [Leucobacter massiliensis]